MRVSRRRDIVLGIATSLSPPSPTCWGLADSISGGIGYPDREGTTSDQRHQTSRLDPKAHDAPGYEVRCRRVERVLLLAATARGAQAVSATTTVPRGGPHLPPAPSGLAGPKGWDFAQIIHSLSSAEDAINNYFIDAAVGAGITSYTLTATLVWERQAGQRGISDLDLYLCDTNSGDSLVGWGSARIIHATPLRIRGLPGKLAAIQSL